MNYRFHYTSRGVVFTIYISVGKNIIIRQPFFMCSQCAGLPLFGFIIGFSVVNIRV